ncbi:hypothetical protein M9H77_17518 [Catharanthus roseus]|uniref:Uncharacterized protein n=1 Tax=Catharanthus roseus TaxID=4058 RepID=A0ACC0B4U7_CATRO|nr:hypothetical protein M9H77_17518 [Catharanthus roseus]
MDNFEDYLQYTINFEVKITQKWEDVDLETFEEIIETEEEYMDHSYLYETDILFDSKLDLVNWARKRALTVNTYLITTRYLSKRRFDHRPYVTCGYERGERRKKKVRLDDDDEDEEEEVPIKRRDGRHNRKIGVYPHTHAQAARLSDDQLKLIEEFTEELYFESPESVMIVTDKESVYGAAQNILHPVIPLNPEDWKNVQGDGNYRFKVLLYFLFSDEISALKFVDNCGMRCTKNGTCIIISLEAVRCSLQDSSRFAHWDGFAPRYCWIDVPDHLILVANTSDI